LATQSCANSGSQTRDPFPASALHAIELSLNHPEDLARRLTWTTDFPEDLQQLERTLRSKQ
jgi:hypothetical protein